MIIESMFFMQSIYPLAKKLVVVVRGRELRTDTKIGNLSWEGAGRA